jgi:hypothetical protein
MNDVPKDLRPFSYPFTSVFLPGVPGSKGEVGGDLFNVLGNKELGLSEEIIDDLAHGVIGVEVVQKLVPLLFEERRFVGVPSASGATPMSYLKAAQETVQPSEDSMLDKAKVKFLFKRHLLSAINAELQRR